MARWINSIFCVSIIRGRKSNLLEISRLNSCFVSVACYLLTKLLFFCIFASTYLSIKSVNPMEWGRQLVSRGANGRQLTTPFFRKVQKDEIKTNHRRHLGWNSSADGLSSCQMENRKVYLLVEAALGAADSLFRATEGAGLLAVALAVVLHNAEEGLLGCQGRGGFV